MYAGFSFRKCFLVRKITLHEHLKGLNLCLLAFVKKLFYTSPQTQAISVAISFEKSGSLHSMGFQKKKPRRYCSFSLKATLLEK